ncbi:MAG: hypothetical protein HFH87_01665 [Lachnospiraceae bacterium]|nr:hypothetical protein [Lachnospiraceae bacterium]
METIFLKILNMSIAAGWMILGVLLLRILLKKAPKGMRCVLWALVGIRLICPISIESVLSLIPSAQTLPREILLAAEPAIESGFTVLDNVVNPGIAESFRPNVGDSVNPLQVLTYVASWLWVMGVAAMLLYALVSCLRLRRRVRTAMKLEGNLWICDTVESPFIFGIVSPRIYLPSDLEEAQMSCITAHERAHLKRRDHWWKPLGYLLLSVYWFQPLCWIAWLFLCRDIELACDERVVREMGGEEKKRYAEVLLKCSMPRHMISACPLAFGELGVKERVKGVLRYKKPAFWLTAAAVLACGAAAVCFLTNPMEKSAEEQGDIYGARYSVAEVLYDAPWYDATYTPDSAPEYVFTPDGWLMLRSSNGVMGNGNVWTSVGVFHETKMDAGWKQDLFDPDGRVGELLETVEQIWRIDSVGEQGYFYLVMRTEDGEILLTTGFQTDGQEHIRWIWKMERNSAQGDTDYLAALIASMYSQRQIQIFAIYESDYMPESMVAGFLDDSIRRGFSVFRRDDRADSQWKIKGFTMTASVSMCSVTLGEDWGLDHSVTLVFSNNRSLSHVKARAGEEEQSAGSMGTGDNVMLVFEWSRLLSEEEAEEIEVHYYNSRGEEIRDSD